MNHYILNVDGGSRGNPGESGIGMVLYDKNNNIIFERSYYVGITTNNHAEYLACLIGVVVAWKKHNIKDLVIRTDSLLMTNQLNKLFTIKNELLKKCFAYFVKIAHNYNSITIIHIPREENAHADMLANKGIDEKILPPKSIVINLQKNNCFPQFDPINS